MSVRRITRKFKIAFRTRCKGKLKKGTFVVIICAALYVLSNSRYSYNTSESVICRRELQGNSFAPSTPIAWHRDMFDERIGDPDWFEYLINDPASYCAGKVIVYDVKCVRFSDIIVVPSRAISRRSGDENILDVFDNKEEDEYFTYEPGFFKIRCECNVSWILTFIEDLKHKNHFKLWTNSLDYNDTYTLPPGTYITAYKYLAISLTRYEYVNAYWVILDIYTSFLTAVIHKTSPKDVTILLLDTHPKGDLDPLWTNLFMTVLRPKDLRGPTEFKHLVWKLPTKDNPLLFDNSNFHVPYFTEFKEALLQSQNVSLNVGLKQRCEKSQLSVLFIWRHDYVAHPRNPSGKIKRKIINEQQLLRAAQDAFPRFHTRGVALESLTIPEQVALLASTDILIGMHGAGLALSVLMPSGGAVGELFPFGESANYHIKRIAQATGLYYRKWTNENRSSEFGDSIYVSVDNLLWLLEDIVRDACRPHRRVPTMKSKLFL